MSAYFESAQPRQLLTAFDAAIALGNNKGGIVTWKKLQSGHYTHTSAQWSGLAFFQPVISANRLTFNIIKPQGQTVSTLAFGYYHGHIIETMLSHFDQQFTAGSATALPTVNDQVA
jgi:hypothetical protein